MCVVSMIMDHYTEKWHQRLPNIYPTEFPVITPPAITSEEIAEFKRLLERAREYDNKNNEPDCELQEKRDTIKKLAKQLGVEIEFL
jgi:hypothetical protein